MTPNTKPAPRLDPPNPSVVFLHAHPDDEAIFTGGTIALLAAAGHTITLIVATSGQLGRQRETETAAAAALLGIERVEFLRYRDSGMPGDPANHHPRAFTNTDPDHAAAQVAAIAAQQHATDLVTYDPGGIYGHPDHLQIHRVGTRAAHHAGIPTIYEATVNPDYLHHRRGPTHLVTRAHHHVPNHLPLGVPPTSSPTPSPSTTTSTPNEPPSPPTTAKYPPPPTSPPCPATPSPTSTDSSGTPATAPPAPSNNSARTRHPTVRLRRERRQAPGLRVGSPDLRPS